MVALLVVLMFAAFIAADYFANREKYRVPAASHVAKSPTLVSEPEPSMVALHFHPAHTWAATENDQVVRIGLDAFAARLLPTPTKVDTPRLARWVSQGARGFTLHCGSKEVSLLSPVDGEVIEINKEAMSHPELLKNDPYGRGWLMKLRSPDMSVSLRNLLGPEVMTAWMDDCMSKLREFMTPAGSPEMAMATAQDGGPMVDSLAENLDAEQWKKLTAEFFRS